MCRRKRPSGLRVQSGLSRRRRRGWRRFGSRLFRGFLRCRLFGSFFSSRLFRGRLFLGDGFFRSLLDSLFGSRFLGCYFFGRWLFGRSFFSNRLFGRCFFSHRLLRCYFLSDRFFSGRFLFSGRLLHGYFLCCRLFSCSFLCGGLVFCGRFFCSCHIVLLDQVNRSLGGKHFVRLWGHTKRSMALDPGPAP